MCYYPGASPVINGCTFSYNEWGALYCIQSTPIVSNCIVYRNEAPNSGGGVYLDNANATIANCTLIENTADSGGGIFCGGSSAPAITNCIVRGNMPDEIYGNNPTVTYCNVQGGYAGDGNIDSDPYFVDPDNFNYRIGPGSPCIDAGNNSGVPAGIHTDVDGASRFVDDPFTDDTGLGDPPIVDMGANEYQADAEGLMVLPAGGFYSEGANGGPFTPGSITYTLQNYQTTALEYSIAITEPWLDLSSDGGAIPAGGQIQVVVSITEYAESMPNGDYFDTIEFTNETNHLGDTTRSAMLAVGVPIPMIVFDFETDPGWSVQEMWAFGQPTGQGGQDHGYPDPTSGYTGDNVYGYNLNGDYSTTVGGPYYLTTTAIDCSNLAHVSLHFQRWLNSDYQPYVYHTIEVSNDGENWTPIWDNGNSEITANSWSEHAFDIAAIADLQPTLYLRWGHQIGSAGAWAYSGWNLDDVEIWGVAQEAPCPWDVNETGIVDIDDVFDVLAHWGQGAGTYDVNDDGTVDIDDVFAILANWGPCPRQKR